MTGNCCQATSGNSRKLQLRIKQTRYPMFFLLSFKRSWKADFERVYFPKCRLVPHDGGMHYLETAAHHPGERAQWRPCRAGGDSGCCSDCRGSRPGVWEEEAGQGWARRRDWWRQEGGEPGGGREGRQVEGSGCRGRRGRSVCLWSLLRGKERRTDCSSCINYAMAGYAEHKNTRSPLSLLPPVDRGSSLSPLMGCPSTIFL